MNRANVFGIIIGTALAFAIGLSWQTSAEQPSSATPLSASPLCPATGEPCPCGCASGAECICYGSWACKGAECWDQKRNVVVFVGGKPRRINGFTVLADKTFCDGDRCISSAIIVGVWRDGRFIRHDLPATATDAQIKSVGVPAPAGTSLPVRVVRVSPAGFCPTCVGGR